MKKLCLLSTALETCPDLIVINGEDLTPYRNASQEIRKHVSSFVFNNRVEKLGLDEFFLDLTVQVENHVQELKAINPQAGDIVTFDLSDMNKISIRYRFGTYSGFVAEHMIPGNAWTLDIESTEVWGYCAASHLVHHIRETLNDNLGYTTSSGIAYNKLLAKLLSDVHKPNLQTVLLSPEGTPVVQELMDTFNVGKLNGFGHRAIKILKDYLGNSFNETVSCVRKYCTSDDFSKLYGPAKGRFLWDLIHGIDMREFTVSSEFPKQISVEDSWLKITCLEDMLQQLKKLGYSLCRRIENEILDEFGQWKIFPQIARLQVRYFDRTCVSLSTAITSELFNSGSSLCNESRANLLCTGSFFPLARRICLRNDPQNISVLNVAVTSFTTNRPSISSISSFIRSSSSFHPGHTDTSDLISTTVSKPSSDKFVCKSNSEHMTEHTVPDLKYSDPVSNDTDESEDTNDDDFFICSLCGFKTFMWAASAHEAYHVSILDHQ